MAQYAHFVVCLAGVFSASAVAVPLLFRLLGSGIFMVYEFKVSDLADEFGVHRNTIRNWINTGILPAKEGPGRKYYTDTQHYNALCEKFGRRPKEAEQKRLDETLKPMIQTEPQPLHLPVVDSSILDGVSATLCLFCESCSSACPISGLNGFSPAILIRRLVVGDGRELVDSDWPWQCTLCMRCEEVCPMNIPIVDTIRKIRGARARQSVPGRIEQGVQACLERGNHLGIARKNFLEYCDACSASSLLESFPGSPLPVDKHGARMLVTLDSRFLFTEPEGIAWWWKILTAAGESWTLSSETWEGVNWAYGSGDDHAMRVIVGRILDSMRRLNCATLLLPENGHAYFATRYALVNWFPEALKEFKFISVFDLILEYLNTGRLLLRQTLQSEQVVFLDSCHFGRKSKREFGKAYWDEGRSIARCCVGSLLELPQYGSVAYCCGGGCGAWVGDFGLERVLHGRKLAGALNELQASHVVTSCLNCRDQLTQTLVKEFGISVSVHYLWELVANSLIVPEGQSADFERGIRVV